VDEEADRLTIGLEEDVTFSVTPTVPNGDGGTDLGVDYAEVVVRYRAP